jgi:hypothetical protein
MKCLRSKKRLDGADSTTDVENAIHRNPVGLAPWRFCDSLPAVCAEAAVAFDRVRRSADLFCDTGLCGS